MDSDFILIQKMKMGNVQAIDIFVQKYYPAILKYCHLHIKDYGYAEDMAQETFERFFRTFSNYQHYGKAANFLYIIAANCCKDYYRKKSEIIMDRLPEKVWSLEVEKGQVDFYLREYQVANVKTVHGGAELRILSASKPAENANLEKTSLEDVFLYYFGERAGMEDA